MKLADVKKLREAGLITLEQEGRIIEVFKLGEERNRLLVVLGTLGGLLLAGGVALMISANWEMIPRFAKLVGGVGLLWCAHFLGIRMDARGHDSTAAGLHLLGSILLLANIALIGQVYNLSSRPGNALLLWWIGIAALPWILRSNTQHVLVLLAFLVWVGVKSHDRSSWFFLGHGFPQFVLFAIIGLALYGLGLWLRASPCPEFAPSTELLGLGLLLSASFPLTFSWATRLFDTPERNHWILVALSAGALALTVPGILKQCTRLSLQWRWTWAFLLLLVATGACAALGFQAESVTYWMPWDTGFYHWLFFVLLFVLSIVLIQIGLMELRTGYVNLGLTSIAILPIRAYVGLFDSMQNTGLAFVGGGILLIGLGWYLERRRRQWVQRIREASATSIPETS